MLFLQVLVDDAGLEKHPAVIDQHRHLAVRVERDELRLLLLLLREIERYTLVGNAFLEQGDPYPLAVRRRHRVVEGEGHRGRQRLPAAWPAIAFASDAGPDFWRREFPSIPP